MSSATKDRVKDYLRSSYPAGLCAMALEAMGGREEDVLELREEGGLDIETLACDPARFHARERVQDHARFVWHFNPRPGAQMTLPGLSARRT